MTNFFKSHSTEVTQTLTNVKEQHNYRQKPELLKVMKEEENSELMISEFNFLKEENLD